MLSGNVTSFAPARLLAWAHGTSQLLALVSQNVADFTSVLHFAGQDSGKPRLRHLHGTVPAMTGVSAAMTTFPHDSDKAFSIFLVWCWCVVFIVVFCRLCCLYSFRSSERGKSDPGGLSLDERASFGAQGSCSWEKHWLHVTRGHESYDGFQTCSYIFKKEGNHY